jgi:uncharacterized protein DUF6941
MRGWTTHATTASLYRGMRTKIVLADSAEVRDGLLFLLGGGWTEVGPQQQPFALAGIIEVDWGETNARHVLDVSFEDEDGASLMFSTPTGSQPLRITTHFEVGRPPGSAHGTSFNVPVAIPMLPVPWLPGRSYVVQLAIDGREVDRLRFRVRADAPSRLP